MERDADAIIESDDELKGFIKGRLEPRLKIDGKPILETPTKHATFYSLIVPVTFLIGWLSVIIFTLLFGIPQIKP